MRHYTYPMTDEMMAEVLGCDGGVTRDVYWERGPYGEVRVNVAPKYTNAKEISPLEPDQEVLVLGELDELEAASLFHGVCEFGFNLAGRAPGMMSMQWERISRLDLLVTFGVAFK